MCPVLGGGMRASKIAMRRVQSWSVSMILLLSPAVGFADQQADLDEEQTLTGDVVALWCYFLEGTEGIARVNSSRQKNCISRGSPVAIKVENRFYLVAEPDSAMRNRLMQLAGSRVVARGRLFMEQGQLSIRLSHVERAREHQRGYPSANPPQQ